MIAIKPLTLAVFGSDMFKKTYYGRHKTLNDKLGGVRYVQRMSYGRHNVLYKHLLENK